jgi:hypothetical protein
MLAHEHRGEFAGEPTNTMTTGVDDPPPLLHFARLGHVRLHLSLNHARVFGSLHFGSGENLGD